MNRSGVRLGSVRNSAKVKAEACRTDSPSTKSKQLKIPFARLPICLKIILPNMMPTNTDGGD